MQLLNKTTIQKIIKYSILFILIWFISHIIYIIYDGTQEPNRKADVAVILGNKVNEDGSLSLRLEKRLEVGLMLYKKERVDRIIVSGGLGKEGFFEADKMRDYLVECGVPDSVIIVDNYGNNTELTIRNVAEINKDISFNSVIAVSQYFHITRIKQLLSEYGYEDVQGCSPRYFEIRDLYSITREFIAFYVNLLL